MPFDLVSSSVKRDAIALIYIYSLYILKYISNNKMKTMVTLNYFIELIFIFIHDRIRNVGPILFYKIVGVLCQTDAMFCNFGSELNLNN